MAGRFRSAMPLSRPAETGLVWQRRLRDGRTRCAKNETTNVSQKLGRRRRCCWVGCGIVLVGKREPGFAPAGRR